MITIQLKHILDDIEKDFILMNEKIIYMKTALCILLKYLKEEKNIDGVKINVDCLDDIDVEMMKAESKDGFIYLSYGGK